MNKGTWYMWLDDSARMEEVMQRLEYIGRGAEAMGVVETVSHDKFPKQSQNVGVRASVTFNYDLNRTLGGLIVREDIELPYETIIKLDDGRYIRGVECQYSPRGSATRFPR